MKWMYGLASSQHLPGPIKALEEYAGLRETSLPFIGSKCFVNV